MGQSSGALDYAVEGDRGAIKSAVFGQQIELLSRLGSYFDVVMGGFERVGRN